MMLRTLFILALIISFYSIITSAETFSKKLYFKPYSSGIVDPVDSTVYIYDNNSNESSALVSTLKPYYFTINYDNTTSYIRIKIEHPYQWFTEKNKYSCCPINGTVIARTANAVYARSLNNADTTDNDALIELSLRRAFDVASSIERKYEAARRLVRHFLDSQEYTNALLIYEKLARHSLFNNMRIGQKKTYFKERFDISFRYFGYSSLRNPAEDIANYIQNSNEYKTVWDKFTYDYQSYNPNISQYYTVSDQIQFILDSYNITL